METASVKLRAQRVEVRTRVDAQDDGLPSNTNCFCRFCSAAWTTSG